jgi:hypothetical protein
MVTYSFIPYIRTEDERKLKKVNNNEDFMKIFDWFKDQINDLSEIFEIPISNIHYSSNMIYFSSENDIEEYTLEDFIDPDKDGNYPITLSDNKLYLIFGKELNIIQ